jgi:hypothetical protein
MANKIATSLPLAELRALCDELAATAGEPTLKQIQEAAAARGVRISLMAATSFRDSTFEGYLAELRRKKEAAELIAEAASAGASQSDAAAALLNQQMLDRLMAGEVFSPEEFSQIILNVSRLRAGDQAGKKLRADLALRDEQVAAMLREKTEWEEERAKIQAAAAALQKTTAKPKASPDDIRKQAVALIDEVMGLKPKATKA